MERRRSITVALSGGKDSTAATLLLREQGWDVSAATMRLGIEGEDERLEKIEALTRVLDVPWQVVDLRREFQERVIDYFLSEHRRGQTPNPCMICNRFLKFGLLLERMQPGGGNAPAATGHYAKIAAVGGHSFLVEPKESRKSQIYFLALIDPKVLDRIVFPLADMTIGQVRAKVAGLPLANPAESQDVCFLAGLPLAHFLKSRIPEAFAPGDILDISGRVIGRHEGVIHYTVGQRRGIRFAAGKRIYVIRTDIAQHTVTLGEERHLMASELSVRSPTYWQPLSPGQRFSVKVRYQTAGAEAEVLNVGPDYLQARFLAPVRALSPGQFAVFYDGDRIVAAGGMNCCGLLSK